MWRWVSITSTLAWDAGHSNDRCDSSPSSSVEKTLSLTALEPIGKEGISISLLGAAEEWLQTPVALST